MTITRRSCKASTTGKLATGLLGLSLFTSAASDWPQYRGPTHDGVSTDRILSQWDTNRPGFVVWRNRSLTNGFSSFAVSQGRAFTLISRDLGELKEVCVAVDAATGTNLWATVIDSAPWDPSYTGDGGSGIAPYYKGDGPRSTPAVKDGRVVALSGFLHLVCLNATNGSVIWSNNLIASYGASEIAWQNAASPRLDGDLIFANLNGSTNNRTLVAFRITDGSRAWSALLNENMTHATPVVATIEGVRQVIFATPWHLVSLNCTNGAFLWLYDYPFYPSTSMGASPIVHSNIVFCSASYGRGAAAARITYAGGNWTATHLYYKTGLNYRSIWMTPVCSGGYVYTLCGENYGTSPMQPLNCIELNTGNLMWFTDDFGRGGTILVDGKVLTLTEDGQLVLSQPDPAAYLELARFRAFDFNAAGPGKCWNSPAVADGRIYARSTRGGICVDVSVPPLRMLRPQFMAGNRLQLLIGTANGSPLDSNRFAKLEVRYTTNLATSLPNWTKLTNSLVLTNGQVRVDNVDGGAFRCFIAAESP